MGSPPIFSGGQPVQRAGYSKAVYVCDVKVGLGRGELGVPHQLLHGPHIGPGLEEVRGEGVTEGMTHRSLLDPGATCRLADRPLYC